MPQTQRSTAVAQARELSKKVMRTCTHACIYTCTQDVMAHKGNVRHSECEVAQAEVYTNTHGKRNSKKGELYTSLHEDVKEHGRAMCASVFMFLRQPILLAAWSAAHSTRHCSSLFYRLWLSGFTTNSLGNQSWASMTRPSADSLGEETST